MTKIAFMAATFSGNRGAEAMLTTAMGRLGERFPGAEFHVFSYYPDDDRLLAADRPDVVVHSATPLYVVAVLLPGSLLGALGRRLSPACRAMAEADVLLDLAGVSFVDGREKFILYNVLSLAPALISGTPVVKLAQALGPFDRRLNRVAARAFLPRCARVFARGAITHRALQRVMGRGTQPDTAADLAFLHKPSDAIRAENDAAVQGWVEQLRARAGDGLVVGICPSSVVHGKAQAQGWSYTGLIIEVTRRLLEAGHRVLLFPNATRERHSPALRNNDLPVIEEIRAGLGGHPRVVAVDRDVNTAGIKRLIEPCDGIVTSRFHAMIAALSLTTPVMVLGWSHKYLEVMAQLGLEDWVLDYSENDPDGIGDRIQQLLSQRADIAGAIAGRLPEVLRASAQQIDVVCDMLASS